MNPAFLDEMSWAMSEVYGAVVDRILVNLARHFPYIKPGQKLPGSFEYQARMLAQMGQVNKETADIIAGSLAGADEALKDVLTAAITEALKGEEPKLRKAAEKGLLQGAGFIPPEVSPNQMQAFRYYYRQSADRLNLVNTVMLESTQSAYTATVADIVSKMNTTQSILNTAAGEVVTGVSTWNQAVRTSVQKMVSNGLTGFIDHGGHHWSPEAYVAMDVRTTVFNTAREAVWERNEDYGNDLYQVSSHNGARPLCYPWQGKVISRTDYVREVEDLDGNPVQVIAQSETSYGQAAGLFGVNCRHYPMSFIPGFSTLKGEPQSPEENEKTYAESQEQRRLERQLREEKRDLDVMKAQGAPAEEIKAQRERVKVVNQKVDDFCEETGRTRMRNREGTPVNAKFPNPDTYDATTFPTAQRDAMRDFYSGKPQQTPAQAEPVAPEVKPVTPPEPAKPTFTPAKTIEEAEKFAESFTDTNRFGAVGISYQGVGLDVANEANKTISEFFNTYKVDKFGGIIAPAANTKMGKLVDGATAAYSPVRNSFLLNRKSLKSLKTAETEIAKGNAMVSDYLKNPGKYTFKSALGRKVYEASAVSGRGTVPTNVQEVLWHELGHSLEKSLKTVPNYDKIQAGFSVFSPKVSGYATTDFGEYIAESFSAWNKGEQIDPELAKGFMALRR
jgi:hypothetical protein